MTTRDEIATDVEPCNDCGRPVVWVESIGDYVHAQEPETACFLVAARPAFAVERAIRDAQIAALRIGARVEIEDYDGNRTLGTVANLGPANVVVKSGKWNVVIPFDLIRRASRVVR